jgi:hypothetical protein
VNALAADALSPFGIPLELLLWRYLHNLLHLLLLRGEGTTQREVDRRRSFSWPAGDSSSDCRLVLPDHGIGFIVVIGISSPPLFAQELADERRLLLGSKLRLGKQF